MRRPDAGLFWNTLRGRLEAESEVEFASPAFCQVEGFPDGILQIGPSDGNLQAHRFDCRPVLSGILGFVRFVFGVHGICFFLLFSCAFGKNSTKQVRFVHEVNTPYRPHGLGGNVSGCRRNAAAGALDAAALQKEAAKDTENGNIKKNILC